MSPSRTPGLSFANAGTAKTKVQTGLIRSADHYLLDRVASKSALPDHVQG